MMSLLICGDSINIVPVDEYIAGNRIATKIETLAMIKNGNTRNGQRRLAIRR